MKQNDIIQLESLDVQQAYLFEENGHWYAYEQSANKIERFVKGFVDFGHRIKDVSGRIKLEIDFKVINFCRIKQCEDSVLVIDCPEA